MKRIGVRELAALLATLDRAKFVTDGVLVEEAPGYLVYLDADRRFLEAMGYAVSVANMDAFRAALTTQPLDGKTIRRAADHLYENLLHELRDSYFLVLSEQEAAWFTNQQPFGEEVAKAFPSAKYDVAEATNCLALGRGTACVFHLARVVESAIRQIAEELNFQIPVNPNWENVIAPFRAELSKPPKDRSVEWNADAAFFASISERVMAIRDAWRNKAVHVEGKYTPDQAEEIWESVRTFMRLMATKLQDRS